jgi:hypothetical protein
MHPACENRRVADHDAGAPLSEMPSSNGAPSPFRDTAAPPLAVSDQDRHRYGLLLDKALERGLLTNADYEVRLRDLAEATSTEQMLAIVTDLPAFARATATASSARRRRSRSPVAPEGSPLADSPVPNVGAVSDHSRSGPWLILIVLVVVVVVTLVVLALSVTHLHRSPTGDPGPLARVLLSVLRF